MLPQITKYLLVCLLFTNCAVNYGQLKPVCHLSSSLKEVSGIETVANSDLIWMVNDSGNSPEVFGVNLNGKIISSVKIQQKNKDWEDLTKDKEGNLYIGDFGNNDNTRKHLKIYKVSNFDLLNKKNIVPEKISFHFPEQKKFPPKKKKRYFDVESFFHHNGYLYLFTKSRVKSDYGKTNLYRIPATPGKHTATFISSFTTCNEMNCWITSAAISPDGKKVVLLSHKNVWQFTNFKGDDFFNGTLKKFDLEHSSQKESICFRDNNSVYIADEYSHGNGRNLYVFILD